MTITLDLTDPEAVALATVIRDIRPPDDLAAAWGSALQKITPQLHATIFAQLKADVLEGLASADRGEGVSEEEMRRIFGLTEKPHD